MAKRKKNQVFVLCGDIIRAGRVLVRAKDKDEAIRKAEAGDFQVHDEAKRGASFVFDGGDEHIEKE